MAEKKKAKGGSRKSAAKGFTEEERAAMRERAKEIRAAAQRGEKADLEKDVRAKIASMSASDRRIGERIHAIIKANASEFSPRLWYGMPAYSRDGNVVCFFQAAGKFKARYATLGFNDRAKLDDGVMWPVAFALTELTSVQEARIRDLVKKAFG